MVEESVMWWVLSVIGTTVGVDRGAGGGGGLTHTPTTFVVCFYWSNVYLTDTSQPLSPRRPRLRHALFVFSRGLLLVFSAVTPGSRFLSSGAGSDLFWGSNGGGSRQSVTANSNSKGNGNGGHRHVEVTSTSASAPSVSKSSKKPSFSTATTEEGSSRLASTPPQSPTSTIWHSVQVPPYRVSSEPRKNQQQADSFGRGNPAASTVGARRAAYGTYSGDSWVASHEASATKLGVAGGLGNRGLASPTRDFVADSYAKSAALGGKTLCESKCTSLTSTSAGINAGATGATGAAHADMSDNSRDKSAVPMTAETGYNGFSGRSLASHGSLGSMSGSFTRPDVSSSFGGGGVRDGVSGGGGGGGSWQQRVDSANAGGHLTARVGNSGAQPAADGAVGGAGGNMAPGGYSEFVLPSPNPSTSSLTSCSTVAPPPYGTGLSTTGTAGGISSSASSTNHRRSGASVSTTAALTSAADVLSRDGTGHGSGNFDAKRGGSRERRSERAGAGVGGDAGAGAVAGAISPLSMGSTIGRIDARAGQEGGDGGGGEATAYKTFVPLRQGSETSVTSVGEGAMGYEQGGKASSLGRGESGELSTVGLIGLYRNWLLAHLLPFSFFFVRVLPWCYFFPSLIPLIPNSGGS